MKLNIETSELLSLLDSADLVGLKKKVAGALIAASNSKEMDEAIELKVISHISKALDSAIIITKSFKGTDISGWASKILKDNMIEQIKALDIIKTIRLLIIELRDKDDDIRTEGIVRKVLKEILDTQAIDTIAERSLDLKINQAVQKRFERLMK
jgi:hypothetical protein